MNHHLEAGIKDLVDEFQASGRPCPAQQSIEDRRAGYVGSVVLAGQSPTVASEFTDVLNGVLVKVYKPTHEESLPITVYFHGGCFVSGGF
ncbi:MAG: alpha/beta hydrolase, partial [Vibrio sp.]